MSEDLHLINPPTPFEPPPATPETDAPFMPPGPGIGPDVPDTPSPGNVPDLPDRPEPDPEMPDNTETDA